MDRRTIHEVGISGSVLMEAAGAGTARLILQRQGLTPGKVVVLCGGGNNGGDGYVVARHLSDAGWTDVVCVSSSDPARLSGDAEWARGLWVGASQGAVLSGGASSVRSKLAHADVIVDALVGTGLSRPVDGLAGSLIGWANESRAFRVAVDLPSGLRADSGDVSGVVFRADLTATYGISKVGLHQWPGAGFAGEVQVVTIGLPRRVVESVGAIARLLTELTAAALLPPRPRDGHKGLFGHVGVVGGRRGMEGAAVLAALGALRSGAGLVTWNRPSSAQSVDSEVVRPAELMMHDLAGSGELDGRSDVLVVGPGLGHDGDGQDAMELAIGSGRSLVVDADGLNMVALTRRRLPPDTVVTPHPAEAARLLGCSVREIQGDRITSTQRLVDRLGTTVVLKGAASLVAEPGSPVTIVPAGEPALSVAGSGDVLSGVIAGLRAQGLAPYDASRLGVFLHARAGTRVGLDGAGRGALATDIAGAVRLAAADIAATRGWR